MEYEAVIGLEVHVQLKTRTKMFTRAPYYYGAEPNTLTDPVVMGLPGTLPVMNKEGVYKCIQLGLICGCEIAEHCKWDRKNYFYPDSPKNYQLSQFDKPLCIGGKIEIELLGASRNVQGEHRFVQLTRIHLEEDVGKLTHLGSESLVDYNRAGAVLAEIVTEPDMHNEDEVFAFLTALRNNIITAGLCDCDMEKGQMRCDANISVRPVGETKLGTKVELKNMNSISGVRNAVAYEIQRQIHACKSDEKIYQETRRWDPAQAVTLSMRLKEESHDYRYFPDPDLMPVRVSRELRDKLAAELPELPFDRQRRYQKDYDLPYTLTSVLCPDRELAEFFEAALALNPKAEPRAIANLVANELLRDLSAGAGSGTGADSDADNAIASEAEFSGADSGEEPAAPARRSLTDYPITPAHVAELVALTDASTITKQIGKEVWAHMLQSGKMPAVIVEEQGLKASNDSGELAAIVAKVVADPRHEKAISQFREGNEKAVNSLIGPIMKATGGKANPQQIQELVRKALEN